MSETKRVREEEGGVQKITTLKFQMESWVLLNVILNFNSVLQVKVSDKKNQQMVWRKITFQNTFIKSKEVSSIAEK